MHLMCHPNSSRMIYDLQQEIKEIFSKMFTDMTGIDFMESISDTLASFNLAYKNKFIVLPIVSLF